MGFVKKKMFVSIALLIIIIAVSACIFAGINKKSRYNGVKVIKIEVKDLMTNTGEPTLLLKVSDKDSMGVVLTAINNAVANKGLDKSPTYNKAGTSTHLLEIYGTDNSIQKVYIALGPNNKGTRCFKETEQYSYTINDKDTNNLRQLILNK